MEPAQAVTPHHLNTPAPLGNRCGPVMPEAYATKTLEPDPSPAIPLGTYLENLTG